jgi:chromate transporter
VTLLLLYGLLLKATVTSFSGMGSLPQIRQDLVVTNRLLTDDQLSHAVVLGRSTPGPIGVYVVSAGYLAAGWPGAVVGWLALVTPALAAIPLLVVVRRWHHLPRVRSSVDAVVVTGGAMLVPAGLQLAREAVSQLSSWFLVLGP